MIGYSALLLNGSDGRVNAMAASLYTGLPPEVTANRGSRKNAHHALKTPDRVRPSPGTCCRVHSRPLHGMNQVLLTAGQSHAIHPAESCVVSPAMCSAGRSRAFFTFGYGIAAPAVIAFSGGISLQRDRMVTII